MTVINTNVKALFTQSALKVAARDGQVAMEQLSTGKRINNSKDDAAGLAIAARMTQNIQGSESVHSQCGRCHLHDSNG
jgi:flagellin